jgi:hypothetical protein
VLRFETWNAEGACGRAAVKDASAKNASTGKQYMFGVAVYEIESVCGVVERKLDAWA